MTRDPLPPSSPPTHLSTDIAIIGGGAIGLAVACFLKAILHVPQRVTVIERDPTWSRASAALSAAGLRQQFGTPVNIALSRFGLEFLRSFPRLDPPQPDLAFHENGYLFLAASPAQEAALREAHATQREAGVDVVLLDPDELSARLPHLTTADLRLASLGLSGEGWFDNMGLLANMKALARAHGAAFVHDDVTGMERDGPRLAALRLGSGGRLACGLAVNAAGARAGRVAAMAGLSLPVAPRKRTVFVFDCAAPPPGPLPLMVDSSGVWMRPEGARFIAGAPPPSDPDVDPEDFDSRHEEFEEIIWPALAARSPAFEALRFRGLWAGHYEWNAFDRNALIGAHPDIPNLIHACGLSGHGLQHAPGIGRGVAEIIATGACTSLDLSPLFLERLLENRPLPENAVV